MTDYRNPKGNNFRPAQNYGLMVTVILKSIVSVCRVYYIILSCLPISRNNQGDSDFELIRLYLA